MAVKTGERRVKTKDIHRENKHNLKIQWLDAGDRRKSQKELCGRGCQQKQGWKDSREGSGFTGKQWVEIMSLKWKCTIGDTLRKMDILFSREPSLLMVPYYCLTTYCLLTL